MGGHIKNPAYKEVTGIYDDAMGTAQMMDRSIVGQFASIKCKRPLKSSLDPAAFNTLKKSYTLEGQIVIITPLGIIRRGL